MAHQEPFIFHTERRLVILTGRKAKNLKELARHLHEVSGSSVFYHTHQQYLSHHFEKPIFHNDFAIWASRALLEEALAERLASIDLLVFATIRQLREAILEKIEAGIAEANGPPRECRPGDEFHFCESMSFIMPTHIVAYDIPDFFAKLPKVTNPSLYFHFFEARLRLGQAANDFSEWIRDRGAPDLAKAIDRLNPYQMTMEELKQEIIRLGNLEGGGHAGALA
jgi:hypothetical protein